MGSGGGLGLVLSILPMSVGLGRAETPCLQQENHVYPGTYLPALGTQATDH